MLLHWKFDPILISFGPVAIHWYGLLFVGAFLLGQTMLMRFFKAEGVPPEYVERLLLYALVGTIVGARLVHCLFYDPDYYLSHPLAILRIWEGGLASHGGTVGLILGLWWGSRPMRGEVPFLWLLDRVAVATAFSVVLIRIANFLNSEILGIPTSGRWGVVFEAVDGLPRHPVQLYEATAYLLIGVILLTVYRRLGKHTPHGLLFGWFMTLLFSARIGLEFFKVHQAAYAGGMTFSVGQYLSLPFVALGVFMIVWSKKRPPLSDEAGGGKA
ncbi:MAG: prolipoprotein diacylglyceryl transferase [Alphaproteobacteria bacterium CG_4_10_14_0_2_um_filter_63_37]|nr:MAG: prolipoprotein diacylglyceryl transferase [Proteobacteria bacterium CG1_02_64_396]PJA25710.1 MAG: prolipoprotein diacylglyceryl transferase [Alphaproteobacteria bacterium CG_4_10_14_0_2_um_filter_63_37]